MNFSEEQRERIAEDAKGKTVESLVLIDDGPATGPYWVMIFTDGSEIAFRFMAEIL